MPNATPANAKVGNVTVVGLLEALQTASTERVTDPVSIDRVLYLQYTGGTTGKAKGAQLTSRNLFINNVQANVFYGYRQGMETVAFDASTQWDDKTVWPAGFTPPVRG